jgi:hypothetical protein
MLCREKLLISFSSELSARSVTRRFNIRSRSAAMQYQANIKLMSQLFFLGIGTRVKYAFAGLLETGSMYEV